MYDQMSISTHSAFSFIINILACRSKVWQKKMKNSIRTHPKNNVNIFNKSIISSTCFSFYSFFTCQPWCVKLFDVLTSNLGHLDAASSFVSKIWKMQMETLHIFEYSAQKSFNQRHWKGHWKFVLLHHIRPVDLRVYIFTVCFNLWAYHFRCL